MLEIKPLGDWKKVRKLAGEWPERAEQLRHRYVRDAAKKFRQAVRNNVPNKPGMNEYKRLMEITRLTGSFKKGECAYAVIADPKEIELTEIDKTYDAVYVVPSKEPVSDLTALLTEYGPWTMDTLPENWMKAQDAKLVTRRVTTEEMDKVREKNMAITKEMAAEFKAAEAKMVHVEEDIKKPKAMPDMQFRVLRMEFGIGQKQESHWRKAYRQLPEMLKEMNEQGKYARWIVGAAYTQWQRKLEKMKKVPIQEFKTLYGEFQKKIVK